MKHVLSILSFFLSCLALYFAISAYQSSKEGQKEFEAKLMSHITACVEYNEEFEGHGEMLAIMEQLKRNQFVLETGGDELCIKFVGLQGCIEHALACSQVLGEVTDLMGVIHTPTVALPLCVTPEESFIDAPFDETIKNDLRMLLTVRSSAQIVRDYLMKGGQIYVAYPRKGLGQRTAAQLQIYRDELQRFPSSLFDCVLSCQEIDPDMIGATYLFKNREGDIFAFSVKARQPEDISEKSEWGFWLGSIDNKRPKERINAVFDYLSACDGPDLRAKML